MSTDILDKFTGHLKNALAKAYSLAVEMEAPGINPEHLLVALLLQKGSIGGEILHKANVSAEEIRRLMRAGGDPAKPGEHRDAPKLTADAKRAIEKAVLTANIHEHKYIGTEHLLSGLLQIDSMSVEILLAEQNIDLLSLKEQVNTVMKSTSKFPDITETFEAGTAPKQKDEGKADKAEIKKAQKAAKAKTPALDFFSTDLTNAKLQEKIDPVIGRDKEIERLVQILCRRTKNNPVLLGEPGVGKTAIVEGLAKRIVKGEVPSALAGKRIFSLDLGLIIAGTIYRGEFEGRLKQIIDEVKNNPEIILFVDELHNIMGAGSTSGSLDAANILKPALARGDMHCIGATTLAEFKKHIESDGALERRFQPIIVNEPPAEVAVKILQGLRENYEQYHGVTISDEAIEAAVHYSTRYITDRFLPDKAIDLIDEAAACVRVATNEEKEDHKLKGVEDELDKLRRRKQKAVVNENFIEALELKTKEKDLEREVATLKRTETKKSKQPIGMIGKKDIAAVIARSTGIPLNQLVMEEKDRLLHLEKILGDRIVGQKEAVTSVAELVRRAKAGIASPKRPLASFLFLGPSGVGKTELAKVLAEHVFQDPEAMVRIDMSEFAEGFNISKLIGAPAGYVGYKETTKLTDIVKRKPHAVVLFDEIEKAHGEVHNLLLQILEDGHITDATGRKINFKNAIIIMTSNVGAGQLHGNAVGFTTKKEGEVTDEDIAATKSGVMQDLENAFRPEFINRIDKVIVFQPLSKTDLEAIVRLQVAELADRLKRDHGIGIEIKPQAVKILAEKSWNPLYGARGVRRQIQDFIENPLAGALLADTYAADATVVVGARNGAISLLKREAAYAESGS